MSPTTSQILVDTLAAWKVDHVFGIPGDGINGVMEALRERQDAITFIQTRHEETAAFMACAYAKFTGRLGVCLATSGPGALHLLNGLYDAKFDGQPVLAITGDAAHDVKDAYFQQDIPLDRVFADVAVYSARITGPVQMRTAANLALKTAVSRRGVAHLSIPHDLQEKELGDDRLSMHHPYPDSTSSFYTESAHIPREKDLRHAADVLNAGRKIAILVGRGALNATVEVEDLADKLAAPVIKALLGRAVLPDDSPYTTGGVGILGTKPSSEALRECDVLLIIGSSFPYMEYLPKPGRVRAIQIDIDPARIGLRYPVEAGIAGDTGEVLRRLIPLLHRNQYRYFLEESQRKMKEWWNVLEEDSRDTGLPMKPQVLAGELSKRLSSYAVVTADCGINTYFWAKLIRVKRGQMYGVSGTLASMAGALPYALAAQIAYPDRQCIAFAGDGGLSMLMGDFATAVKYHLPVKVFVLKNSTLAQIKWEQMMFLGNPEYGCELQPIDFSAFARACGATGFHIERAEDCGSIIDQALAAPGPVIVEAVVDPLEPMLPPEVSEQFQSNIAKALQRGEKDADAIRTIVNEREKELVGV